jgi:hypothetical protein
MNSRTTLHANNNLKTNFVNSYWMLKIHRKQILTDPKVNQPGKRGKQKQEIEYKKEIYYFLISTLTPVSFSDAEIKSNNKNQYSQVYEERPILEAQL